MSLESPTTPTTLPARGALRGLDVRDRSGETVGTVTSVYESADGTVRYLNVRTGWFGAKHMVVPVDDVQLTDDGNALVLPYDRSRLTDAPAYDEAQDLNSDDEAQIYGHYGRAGYWEAVRARQTVPSPTPEIAQADVAETMARGDREPFAADAAATEDREVRYTTL